AERAARMIRDLLDFTQARLGGGIPVTPREVELAQLLAHVMEEFEHSHPERKLVLIAPDTLQATLDPDRVVQALANLIGNALTYSPPGTTVTVRAAVEGSDVLLEVHNEGEPVPEERLGELFKPLSRGGQKVNM